jgi:hypothetical protein
VRRLNISQLGDQIFQGQIYSFNYFSSPEKDFETSIDLTLINDEVVRTFRFLHPSQIEVDGRHSTHNDLALEILDMSDGQMEYVNLLVRGVLENVGDFTFWAKDVIEITKESE